jgi:signal transduction histidine kinase
MARVQRGPARTVEDILKELANSWQAEAAVVVLRDRETSRVISWTASQTRGKPFQAVYGIVRGGERTRYLLNFPAELIRGARMDDGSFELTAITGEKEKLQRVRWKNQLGFLEEQVRARFVSVTIEPQKDRWSGRLYLIDVPRASTAEPRLQFLAALLRQVVPAVHNVALLQQVRSQVAARERKRIAGELHDGIVPSVAALEMGLHVLSLHQNGAEDSKLLQDLQGIVHKMILDVRHLIHGLYPVDFSAGSLMSNLAVMVAKFEQTGIRTEFSSDIDDPKLPPGGETEVGRIVQEALINARKHGAAKNVSVRVKKHERGYSLTVEDDGKGFEFSGRRTQFELQSSGIGPRMIHQRVNALGGDFSIESRPGQGTCLEVFIPEYADVTDSCS